MYLMPGDLGISPSVDAIRAAVENLGARGNTFLFEQVREELKIAAGDKNTSNRIRNVMSQLQAAGAITLVNFDDRKRNRLYRVKDRTSLRTTVVHTRRRSSTKSVNDRSVPNRSNESQQLQQVRSSVHALHDQLELEFKQIREKLDRLESLILLRSSAANS
jgi:hypothetical protein